MNLDHLLGAHLGMSAADYHAIDAASASRLKTLWRSTPMHLRHEMDATRTETPAMRIGTLAHLAALEPDEWQSSVVVMPPVDRRTKAGKEEAAAFEEANAGLSIVSLHEHYTASRIAEAVSGLLPAGQSEVSIIARDPVLSAYIKARIDRVPDGSSLIMDLKTCRDASPRGFQRDSYNLGYHIQAALYLDLWNAVCGSSDRRDGFAFVAVESEAPHAAAVYECSADFLDAGRRDYMAALETYAKCKQSGEWPGYTNSTLNLPAYAQ